MLIPITDLSNRQSNQNLTSRFTKRPKMSRGKLCVFYFMRYVCVWIFDNFFGVLQQSKATPLFAFRPYNATFPHEMLKSRTGLDGASSAASALSIGAPLPDVSVEELRL